METELVEIESTCCLRIFLFDVTWNAFQRSVLAINKLTSRIYLKNPDVQVFFPVVI
jgi:hypothetical protein